MPPHKESEKPQGKEISPNSRLLIDNIEKKGQKLREYSPSTTEKILEEICKSFGTELGQAYIDTLNGIKLVRLSTPVVLTNEQTNKKTLLQCQYTRFSPFGNSKMLDIYNKNANSKKKLSWADFEVSSHEVTDSHYFPVALHRWQKALYFSVFNLEDKEVMPEKLKPFLIHEYGNFNKKPPYLHIEFSIEPCFVIGNLAEDSAAIYDEITFSYPQTSKTHDLNISQALSLCPLDKLNPESFESSRSKLKDIPFEIETQAFFREIYKISSLVPRTTTMNFINTFLKSECLGRRF